METFIQLSDMHFYAYHGCLPTENVIGTDYIVNLKIGLDLSKAMESDDLKDTINYQIIYDLIEKEIHQQSKLIEHVAGRIVKVLHQHFPQITSLKLKLSKTNPPLGGEVASADIIVETTFL